MYTLNGYITPETVLTTKPRIQSIKLFHSIKMVSNNWAVEEWGFYVKYQKEDKMEHSLFPDSESLQALGLNKTAYTAGKCVLCCKLNFF